MTCLSARGACTNEVEQFPTEGEGFIKNSFPIVIHCQGISKMKQANPPMRFAFYRVIRVHPHLCPQAGVQMYTAGMDFYPVALQCRVDDFLREGLLQLKVSGYLQLKVCRNTEKFLVRLEISYIHWKVCPYRQLHSPEFARVETRVSRSRSPFHHSCSSSCTYVCTWGKRKDWCEQGCLIAK